MKIEKLDMNIDTAELKITGPIDPDDYKRIALANFEKSDVVVVSKEEYTKLLVAASAEDDFSADELFLLEMACNEVCYKMNHDTFIYNKFKALWMRLHNMHNRRENKE